MSRFIANVALAYKGSRIERGAQFDMTDEEADAFDPQDITLSIFIPLEEEEIAAEVPVDEMSQPELKAKAKELGLATGGSKADLQERIALHLAGTAEVPVEAQATDGE